MKEHIIKACKQFCDDMITKHAKNTDEAWYVSQISVTTDGKIKEWAIAYSANILHSFALSHFDRSLNKTESKDLCNEITNVIAGLAKATLSDQNPKTKYELGLPRFIKKTKYKKDIQKNLNTTDLELINIGNFVFIIGG